jgi:hypothetical protein
MSAHAEPLPADETRASIHTHTEGWARSPDALSEVETPMENEGDLERLAPLLADAKIVVG